MLNLTRRLILERAGFVVLTVQRASDVDHLPQDTFVVDLVVLCSSTEREDCERLFAVAEVFWPHVPKLWLGDRYQSVPAYLPQDVTPVREGPGALHLAALQSFQHITANKS